jgi:hypothetical protein
MTNNPSGSAGRACIQRPIPPNLLLPPHCTQLDPFYTSFLAVNTPSLLQSTRATMKVARVSQSLVRNVGAIRSYSTVHDLPHTSGSFAQPPTPPIAADNTSVFQKALNATAPRNDWTKEQISEIHQIPLMELAFAAVCSSHITVTFRYTHYNTRAPYIENSTNLPPSSYVPS